MSETWFDFGDWINANCEHQVPPLKTGSSTSIQHRVSGIEYHVSIFTFHEWQVSSIKYLYLTALSYHRQNSIWNFFAGRCNRPDSCNACFSGFGQRVPVWASPAPIRLQRHAACICCAGIAFHSVCRQGFAPRIFDPNWNGWHARRGTSWFSLFLRERVHQSNMSAL